MWHIGRESSFSRITCSDQSDGSVQQPASRFEGWSHCPWKSPCQQLWGSSPLPLQRQSVEPPKRITDIEHAVFFCVVAQGASNHKEEETMCGRKLSFSVTFTLVCHPAAALIFIISLLSSLSYVSELSGGFRCPRKIASATQLLLTYIK